MWGFGIRQLRVCQSTKQTYLRSNEPPGLLEQEVFLLLLVAIVHLLTCKITLVCSQTSCSRTEGVGRECVSFLTAHLAAPA